MSSQYSYLPQCNNLSFSSLYLVFMSSQYYNCPTAPDPRPYIPRWWRRLTSCWHSLSASLTSLSSLRSSDLTKKRVRCWWRHRALVPPSRAWWWPARYSWQPSWWCSWPGVTCGIRSAPPSRSTPRHHHSILEPHLPALPQPLTLPTKWPWPHPWQNLFDLVSYWLNDHDLLDRTYLTLYHTDSMTFTSMFDVSLTKWPLPPPWYNFFDHVPYWLDDLDLLYRWHNDRDLFLNI